ncbi:accessory gene regulator B family protein [Cohnella nanjingensis]|uniref:Accessory gene regulator B family protein n=1 Tax=Cohnella nanjingensis TaxID=1387779 RepID=A0A7X0RR32_9BACL|nr:accessory gene regulator B family protein [Cohnella nanjingensis]MBB6672149.1 accessory gene regulator B family protein [Cohnella nanjingensis]
MIENLSEKLAVSLKNAVPDYPGSVARLKFGIHIILNTILTIAVAVILGIVIHDLASVMVILFSFALLRAFSGGIHVKIALLCILVSAVAAALLAMTKELAMPGEVFTALNVISMLLVLVYAPSRIAGQTRIPRRFYPLLKVISLLIVGSNFLLHSDLLAVTWFVQSLTLIRRLKGGESR